MLLLPMFLLACSPEIEEEAAVAPVAVSVQAARLAPIQRELNAQGVVEALQQVTLVSESAGRVQTLAVELGQTVSEGELLVQLEAGRQRLAVQAAEASLAKADALAKERAGRLDRARKLKGGVSTQDLESAELALAVAQADLLSARANLGVQRRALADTSIKAPFAGRVTRLMVDAEQQLGVGAPVANLSDPTVLRVRLGVSWAVARQLTVHDPVTLNTEGGALEGQVYAIGQELDRATGTVPIELRADNPGLQVLPNAAAQVQLRSADEALRLSVPVDAVGERFGEPVAFVVEGPAEGGVARQRRLELGLRGQARVEVLGGIGEGDRVVVVGAERLIDGAPVTVVGP